VSPLCANSDGMTAVHYAIELERFDYLSFLFEGDKSGISEEKDTKRGEESPENQLHFKKTQRSSNGDEDDQE